MWAVVGRGQSAVARVVGRTAEAVVSFHAHVRRGRRWRRHVDARSSHRTAERRSVLAVVWKLQLLAGDHRQIVVRIVRHQSLALRVVLVLVWVHDQRRIVADQRLVLVQLTG